MEVNRDKNGKLYYLYSTQSDDAPAMKGSTVYLDPSEVLHIPGLGFDGLVGYSPVAMAKNAIGMAIACEEYGAKFFANGAAPGGVLEHPGTIKDPQRVRESWHSTFGGSGNANKIAVLEEGMKYTPIGISPEQAQFLETRKFQINEIARIFRVPPHMVGDLEKSSFSNIEQQSLEFVKYTLDPWVIRWEQSIQRSLLSKDEKAVYFVKFNLEGLLRGDYQSRMNGYAIGRQNGWMSANDIRELENLDRIPAEDGGDLYLINGNMLPLQNAGAFVGDSNTAITAGTNYALSGAKSHILTVKANVMAELPGIDYRCVITYKDESTGLSLTHPLTISFSRVVNGSGIVDPLVTTPNGNVFKNEEVASLTAKAELWRGSTVDTTKVSYKWAVMDASVTATSSTGYDADFGIGWRKLSDTADKYTGTATNTLTVYAAAVNSYAVFKCCAQDTDSASASYNTKFFDVATFIDNSDPLQIIVTSTGGDVFKNGQGTTVLTAVCYQAGSEVDAAGNGSYTWTKYNKDGVVDTSWGTNGSKTGKTLSVSSADVDTKATFMVVVAL